MTISKQEAMVSRHTVRKYLDKPLSPEVVSHLEGVIAHENEVRNLEMCLMRNDTSPFGPLLRAVLAKGVQNYVVLAGVDAPDLEERLGYASGEIMLQAQMLGLNSWWIGGTYNRTRTSRASETDCKVVGIVAIGYGATQGKPHRSKTASQVSSYEGTPPVWFARGVEAALLAPTAINRQAFFIEGTGDEVRITYKKGTFSGCDLGLVKYHFELGAGAESFHYA